MITLGSSYNPIIPLLQDGFTGLPTVTAAYFVRYLREEMVSWWVGYLLHRLSRARYEIREYNPHIGPTYYIFPYSLLTPGNSIRVRSVLTAQ